jgi:DNA invertase Pin-like site-specific DNA recombinase/Arc/MetJ-type ribon-helix-helix transcriptional regulator
MDPQRLAGKRVAIYARYSSALQRECSIEDQVRRCSEFVQRHGGMVDPDLIFSDVAISGASLARPSFEHMMQRLDEKPCPIGAVVTEDISRISRDFADAALVFKKMQYLQVPLFGVGDGIDTSSKHAKLTYTIKSLVSDLYLDDLRDKTLRGLEGRALAGFSTGGLPYGYRSSPVIDAERRVIGHLIEIDADAAVVVRRIFSMYLEGSSQETIAKTLDAEKILPPRAKSKHRKKGWIASTVRAFLHNEMYVGRRSYKKKLWSKVPGTNTRRYQKRDASEVIHKQQPELRIVDEQTWAEVQARLARVRACYVGKAAAAGVTGTPGRKPASILSGLLFCGVCGAHMILSGGSSANYYVCIDHKKRGTCSNALSVREDVARARILEAIRERFSNPAAIAYLRKRIAEQLGDLGRTANAELREHSDRLARTEDRIGGLVQFIADGDRSAYVRDALKDLEAQARVEKAAIAAIQARARMPVRLPTPDEVVQKVLDLEQVLAGDKARGREELRKLFDGGRVVLTPDPAGHYVATSKLLPLVVLAARATKHETPAVSGQGPMLRLVARERFTR